jgi:hypothetical protein
MASEGSTSLGETNFKCPSRKPCGAALIDSMPTRIKKRQPEIKYLRNMIHGKKRAG